MLDLYKNIKKLRLENNWSQGELAKRAGYKDRSAIAHIEDGRIDLPQSKIFLFAKIFGVTPSELFGSSKPTSVQLSPIEEKVILAYRSSPPVIQNVVHDVLHVSGEDTPESGLSSDAV